MKFEDLKHKMHELTGILVTHPNRPEEGITEVWMKFKHDGIYFYINLEAPIPDNLGPIKLIGPGGNALNCSSYKKDKLIQYNEKNEIIDKLDKSMNYRSNIKETVIKTKELISAINRRMI